MITITTKNDTKLSQAVKTQATDDYRAERHNFSSLCDLKLNYLTVNSSH